MSRLVEGLVAGGLIAGVVWYTRRDRKNAAAERLARLTDARAQLATAIAHADGAVAAGNVAGAAARRKTNPSLTASQSPPSPATSAPRPAPSPAPVGISRWFDDLFRLHGRGIPVAYLRALAHAESAMNPGDRLGLINVVPIALADYNRRHPAAQVRPEQMRDPTSNITVAADILRTIIDSYRRNHPDVANLVEDWSNRRFAELLSLGWNGGYSELAGVGRVVGFLKTQPTVVRPADITIDSVFDAAWKAGAASTLTNARKRDYSKGVAASYVREVARDARDGLTTA